MSKTIKKKVRLKKECFKCGYFDKSFGAQRYKCAVSWSCPGINWSEKRKQAAINRKIGKGSFTVL